MDIEDFCEGPCAKCADKGDVSVDAEDVSRAPRAKVLAEASCCSLR